MSVWSFAVLQFHLGEPGTGRAVELNAQQVRINLCVHTCVCVYTLIRYGIHGRVNSRVIITLTLYFSALQSDAAFSFVCEFVYGACVGARARECRHIWHVRHAFSVVCWEQTNRSSSHPFFFTSVTFITSSNKREEKSLSFILFFSKQIKTCPGFSDTLMWTKAADWLAPPWTWGWSLDEGVDILPASPLRVYVTGFYHKVS